MTHILTHHEMTISTNIGDWVEGHKLMFYYQNQTVHDISNMNWINDFGHD